MQVKDILKNIDYLKSRGYITDETEVIYAADDEGNSYHEIVASPSVVYLDTKPSHYIDPDSVFWLDEVEYKDKDHLLSVLCIN